MLMNEQTIKEIALKAGFKLKEQQDGKMDLNPYVYYFAIKLLEAKAYDWISVNDRLPLKYDYVLVAGDFGITIANYAGDGQWDFNDSDLHNDQVTHWRPIPPRPKGL